MHSVASSATSKESITNAAVLLRFIERKCSRQSRPLSATIDWRYDGPNLAGVSGTGYRGRDLGDENQSRFYNSPGFELIYRKLVRAISRAIESGLIHVNSASLAAANAAAWLHGQRHLIAPADLLHEHKSLGDLFTAHGAAVKCWSVH
jgi:hypothetical protein